MSLCMSMRMYLCSYVCVVVRACLHVFVCLCVFACVHTCIHMHACILRYSLIVDTFNFGCQIVSSPSMTPGIMIAVIVSI